MMHAIETLVNNPAFWTFLGIVVTSYFGYKQVMKKSPAGKLKADARNASSFEELRAVVEVLQGELIKKDKRHKDDTDYMLNQLTEARGEVRSLSMKLGEALKKLAVSEHQNDRCTGEIKHLRDVLTKHGIVE